MNDFAGRVAVITGGGGGIGKAMGAALAAAGARIVLSDVHQPSLDAAVEELRGQGADAIGVLTDVSQLESVEALRDATVEHFGRVDVVCNNAGVASGAHGQLWEHEINDWRYAMSVHVYGVINGINAFVPWLLEHNDDGYVVNTSSHNGGFAPVFASPTYATCKAAVVTLSECLHGQLRAVGSNIGVSVLFPSGRTEGILNTGIWTPRERPAGYESDAPIDTTSKMQMWIDMKEQAGDPVQFTPLSEVAETMMDGLRARRFWMVEEGRFEELVQARADVILRRADPQYPIGA